MAISDRTLRLRVLPKSSFIFYMVCTDRAGLFCVFRQQENHQAPAFHFGRLISSADFRTGILESVKKRPAVVGVSHFPSAETDRNLHLVTAAQELDGLVCLCLEIVGVDVHGHPDFLDFYDLLVLSRFFFTLCLGLAGAYITKATAQLMRDFGSIQSPQNAYLLNLGLESLHLRMRRHCENAQAVAEYLEKHPKVSWVNYCGLASSKYHELAQKYLPDGCCGVVSFGVEGGRTAAELFMKNLKLASIVTHVADAKTCVLHPASSTHRQMNDAELAAAGVRPDLIRFSVGIEDKADILADLEQALSVL